MIFTKKKCIDKCKVILHDGIYLNARLYRTTQSKLNKLQMFSCLTSEHMKHPKRKIRHRHIDHNNIIYVTIVSTVTEKTRRRKKYGNQSFEQVSLRNFQNPN